MLISDSTESRTWRITPDLLGIVNLSGQFEETNPAWERTLGWSTAEIRERTYLDFLHPDDVERTNVVFAGLKDGKSALRFENRYRCKDDSYRWLSWVAVPEGDKFFCSARDITVEKQHQRALENHEDEAALREEFIAVLGHDLRNPLAAIDAAARIAAREPQGETTTEMLSIISSSTQRMARLINAIMDFAHARLGGGMPLEMNDERELRATIAQVIEELRLAHANARIELNYSFNETLKSDPRRLGQMLSNLIANALVHGDNQKAIRVDVGSKDGHFVMSVTNVGEPIPQSARDELFKPFNRAHAGASLQGLGLGLYIVSEIAKAHGGTIEVTSDETETCFKFTMPLAETSKQNSPAAR